MAQRSYILLTLLALLAAPVRGFADEKPPLRAVLNFHPRQCQSPQELLDGLQRVDWWVAHSATKLTPQGARDELLGLHFDNLAEWLLALPVDTLAAEPRDDSYDPPITLTEKAFLSWDLQVKDRKAWLEVKDLALDDLRFRKPEAALSRYREFAAKHDPIAMPDQVLLFTRQIAADRVRAGGKEWINNLVALYDSKAGDLLSRYPEFLAMGQFVGRTPALEELYNGSRVELAVWPLETILEILTATGPDGYQAILRYRDAAGEQAFLPYPERLALNGGGLGYPLLTSLLSDPALPLPRRQAMLAVALDHAATPRRGSIDLANDLITGAAVLYTYAPDQVAGLADQARLVLNTGDNDPAELDTLVVFPPSGAPEVPQPLREPASMALRFPDPFGEVDSLLKSAEPRAQAIGLAAMALALENTIDFTADEWAGTEPAYLNAIAPFLGGSTPPVTRELALLVLLRLANNPVAVSSTVAVQLTGVSGSLDWLTADDAPQPYQIAARVLALRWLHRGLGFEVVVRFAVAVRAYAETADPGTLGLEAALDLLRFNADLLATAGAGISPTARLGIASSALDKMNLFGKYEGLQQVLNALADLTPSESTRAALQLTHDKLSGATPPADPSVLAQIEALLYR